MITKMMKMFEKKKDKKSRRKQKRLGKNIKWHKRVYRMTFYSPMKIRSQEWTNQRILKIAALVTTVVPEAVAAVVAAVAQP